MLTQYKYFVAVAEFGGMTAAANALNVSQPAISRSLKALEFALDVTLLDRATGQLTAAGEMLLKRARLLLAEQRSIVEDLREQADGHAGAVRLNGSPMTAMLLIPNVVSYLAERQPQLRVSVLGDNGANYDWKLAALVAGDLDVVLTIADPALSEGGLVQFPLFEPELRVVLKRRSKAARPPKGLESLLESRWILPPAGSSTRRVVENAFRVRNLPLPRQSIEMSDWRIILDVVRTTDWVTILPYHPSCFYDHWSDLWVMPGEFDVRPIPIIIAARPTSLQRKVVRDVIDAAYAVVNKSLKRPAKKRTAKE